MTGTVDDNRRFINIDIFHPGGSNVWLFGVCYIVFAPQIRTPGKYLIGDNAYTATAARGFCVLESPNIPL